MNILGLVIYWKALCLDARLQAAMASIWTDDRADGMRNNFKAAAAHILPYDLVAKKRAAAGSKHTATQISLAEVGDVGEISSASKVSIGKSGVHLRYHTLDDITSSMMSRKLNSRNGKPIPQTQRNLQSNTSRQNATITKPSTRNRCLQ